MHTSKPSIHRYTSCLVLVAAWLLTPLIATAQERSTPTNQSQTDNARDLYLQAAEALVDKEKIGHSLTPAQEYELVKKNQRGLELIQRGLALPFGTASKPPETPADFEVLFAEHKNWRSMARLLATNSRVKAAQGDISAATGLCLDGMQFGEQLRRSNTLIGFMVAQACSAIGRAQLQSILPQLDAVTAKSAANRWELMLRKRPTFAEVLRAENQTSEKLLRQQYAATPDLADEVVTHYRELVEWEITASVQPYIVSGQKPERSILQAAEDADVDPAEDGEPPLTMGAKTIAENIFVVNRNVFRHARFNDVKDSTFDYLLLAKLALYAYESENGEAATSLQQLVPKYLKAVPLDPFGLNEPLRYTAIDGVWTLYSIGPDGLDDAGQPLPSYNPETGRYTSVEPDTRGDIVALYEKAPTVTKLP